MGRVVAVDYGLARTGVALSDPTKTIAQSKGCLNTKGASIKEVCEALFLFLQNVRQEIEAVVVGLPLHLDGQPGTLAPDVQNLVHHLRESVEIPIILFDERLTTKMVVKALKEKKEKSRKKTTSRRERASVVDGLSAQIILQNYLDSLHPFQF